MGCMFQAVWLPGSQTELAIVTADFVKASRTVFSVPCSVSVCVCVRAHVCVRVCVHPCVGVYFSLFV